MFSGESIQTPSRKKITQEPHPPPLAVMSSETNFFPGLEDLAITFLKLLPPFPGFLILSVLLQCSRHSLKRLNGKRKIAARGITVWHLVSNKVVGNIWKGGVSQVFLERVGY